VRMGNVGPGCSSAPSCQRVEVPSIVGVDSCTAAIAELPSCGELMDDFTADPPSGLQQGTKVKGSKGLREYTYAVDMDAIGLANAEEERDYNLSHRSNMSDLDRVEEFQRKKLEVLARERGIALRAEDLKNKTLPVEALRPDTLGAPAHAGLLIGPNGNRRPRLPLSQLEGPASDGNEKGHSIASKYDNLGVRVVK